MKRILHLFLLILLPLMAVSQPNASFKNLKVSTKAKIGSSSFDGSAILTITSTTKGVLMPRMNTTERDAIGSPTDGLLIFNNQTNQYEFFETTWQAVGGGGADGNGIYDGDGSLGGNTTVSQDGNTLAFEGSIVNSFSVDGSTFSIDANNNRVGIGTASPTSIFNVEGGLTTLSGENAASTSDVLFLTDNTGTTPIFRVQNNGDIGINDPTPSNLLTLRVGTSDGIVLKSGSTEIARLASNSSNHGQLLLSNSSGALQQQFNAGLNSYILNNNFGLGTATPGHELTVKKAESGVVRIGVENTTTTGTNTKASVFWKNGSSEFDISLHASTFTSIAGFASSATFFADNIDIKIAAESTKNIEFGIVAANTFTEKLTIDPASGNMALGASITFDGTATSTLSIRNAVAPSAGVANHAQLYSADHNGAGTATLFIVNEENDIIKLFADGSYVDPTGTTDKGTFATSTVTTEDLAEFVKAMYETLKAQGLIKN